MPAPLCHQAPRASNITRTNPAAPPAAATRRSNITIPASFVTRSTGDALKELLKGGAPVYAVMDWQDILPRQQQVGAGDSDRRMRGRRAGAAARGVARQTGRACCCAGSGWRPAGALACTRIGDRLGRPLARRPPAPRAAMHPPSHPPPVMTHGRPPALPGLGEVRTNSDDHPILAANLAARPRVASPPAGLLGGSDQLRRPPYPCSQPDGMPPRLASSPPAGLLGVLDQLQRPVRPGVRRAEGVHPRVRARGQGGWAVHVLCWAAALRPRVRARGQGAPCGWPPAADVACLGAEGVRVVLGSSASPAGSCPRPRWVGGLHQRRLVERFIIERVQKGDRRVHAGTVLVSSTCVLTCSHPAGV